MGVIEKDSGHIRYLGIVSVNDLDESIEFINSLCLIGQEVPVVYVIRYVYSMPPSSLLVVFCKILFYWLTLNCIEKPTLRNGFC